MTILIKVKVDREESDKLELKLIEAPYHNSNSNSRYNWIYYGKSFFRKEISDLWNIYSNELSDCTSSDYSYFHECEERRRFIKSPFYILSNAKITLGGIWFDQKLQIRNSHLKGEIFHIILNRKAREKFKGISNDLLNFYLNDAKTRSNFVQSAWNSNRPESLNPSNFFIKNDFEVEFHQARKYFN